MLIPELGLFVYLERVMGYGLWVIMGYGLLWVMGYTAKLTSDVLAIEADLN